MCKEKYILLMVICLIPFFLISTIRYVPSVYQTIQQAVDASVDGDIIEVSAGTYNENIEIEDLEITLRGVDGVKETIIQGVANGGSVIAILSDDEHSDDFLIEGFTISGGDGRPGVHFGGGIFCEGEDGVLRDLLIINNDVDVNGKGGGIYIQYSDTVIENCTIMDNYASLKGGGLYLAGTSTFDIKNCIIYDNDILDDNNHVVTENIYHAHEETVENISYTLLQDGIGGINNEEEGTITSSEILDTAPCICRYSDNDIDLKYYLLEYSPCIDAGNPSSLYNDEDNTRNDMGALATIFDVKEGASERWCWESFPRVGSLTTDIYDIASDVLDMDDLYPIDNSAFQVASQQYQDHALYTGSYWYRDRNLFSALGYKLYRDSNEYMYYIPLEGYRLSNTYQFGFTANQEKWLGYWIPETRNIEDAFNDLWSHVKSIEAWNWYYQRATGGITTPSSSTAGKNLVYGKMYIVTMDISTTYTWDPPGGGGQERTTKSEPQYFTYYDQPDYLAIDVLDIPQGIEEIGVFQESTCIGASVIDSSSVQILAYIDPELRNIPELSLQYSLGDGTRDMICDYWIYNESSKEFNKGKIMPQGEKHIIISLEDDYPVIDSPLPGCHLYQNYPNPFNPETKISFYLSSEASGASLGIYNIRGQQIRSYDISDRIGGSNQTIVWDGKDTFNRSVSSGVYFYRLNSNQGYLSRKMILMK